MYLPRMKRPHSVSLLISLFMLVAIGAITSRAFAAQGREIVGVPTIGSRGISRTVGDLMLQEKLHPSIAREPIMVPDHESDEMDEAMRDNPLAPRVASIPNLPPEMLTGYQRDKGLGAHVFSPQTLGPNFTAATLGGKNPTNAFPPDCDGAIGPAQYIVGVNGRIVSFSKTTGAQDGVLNLSTDNFFNSVRAGIGTSDPQVRYDRTSGRWFAMIINVSTPNLVLIGVSDAASAGVITNSSVWTFFSFNIATLTPAISNSCLADYPSLGVDANALYIGTDNFCPSFTTTDGFVVRKSSIMGAGPLVVTAFRAIGTSGVGGPFAPRGVDNPDPASTEGYFVGSDISLFGQLDLVRVANPGGTPSVSTYTAITVPLSSTPIKVPHRGNSGGANGRVDGLNTRLFYASIRNGQLWTCNATASDNTGVVGNNTRDGCRWYQINVPVGAGAPTVVQAGIVFTPNASNVQTDLYYWMPSIAVSGQGHAVMGFSTADSLVHFIDGGTVGRLASDPLGAMGTPISLTASTTAYNPTGDTGAARGSRRWGDYSVTTVDPTDDMSMWTVQEFCDSTNSYGVRVAKLLAPPPATPSALADLAPGVASISVTLTGLVVSGSGFFDPGPNIPGVPAYNHLSVAITAGAATGTPPTVVSASYVNPTTVNLVLNTTSATSNLPGQFYTITVTNPDGQSASAAIVHVANPVITASAGPGGSISPSGAVTVTFGTDQTFTSTPNSCFVIADVLVDGSSVGAVSSYTFRNVRQNHTIAPSFTAGLPLPVTGLTSTQVLAGNGPSGRTGIRLTFTPPTGATSVEVWRLGYGNYPTYSGGSTPPAPGSYPPAGWSPTLVTASGQVDTPPSRDFWYYVAYAKDGCANVSPVSSVTSGSLDYHLADVSDGANPGTGDNTINTADASLLGAHYGASGGALAGFEYLDVGPTTNFSTLARPTPDGAIGFEDLVMLALNYTPQVSLVAKGRPVASATTPGNSLEMKFPLIVTAGERVDVPLTLSSGGDLQALSVSLGWDKNVVAPLEMSSTDLVSSQGGVEFSPGPGQLDAAILGAGRSLVGSGLLATAHFRALVTGDPAFRFDRVVGRDATNKAVSIATRTPLSTESAVTATELFAVVPNPARSVSYVGFAIATRSPVNLAVYSVDGRRVKTLLNGVQEAGRYHSTWNGTDEHGAAVKSGLYFVRLDAGAARMSRLMTLIR